MGGENISFRVGGIEARAVRGQTILQALLAEGKDVPHICYQPNLGPIKTCDTCIVEGKWRD